MGQFRKCVLAAIGASVCTAGGIHSQGAEIILGLVTVILVVIPWENWGED